MGAGRILRCSGWPHFRASVIILPRPSELEFIYCRASVDLLEKSPSLVNSQLCKLWSTETDGNWRPCLWMSIPRENGGNRCVCVGGLPKKGEMLRLETRKKHETGGVRGGRDQGKGAS